MRSANRVANKKLSGQAVIGFAIKTSLWRTMIMVGVGTGNSRSKRIRLVCQLASPTWVARLTNGFGISTSRSWSLTSAQSYIPPDPKSDKALIMAEELLRGVKTNLAFPSNANKRGLDSVQNHLEQCKWWRCCKPARSARAMGWCYAYTNSHSISRWLQHIPPPANPASTLPGLFSTPVTVCAPTPP